MTLNPDLLPPLSLYVHLPWCIRKCPYCDFNSYTIGLEVDRDAYVEALLKDLALESASLDGRTVQSVFLGGGTPSLFEARQIKRLLRGIRQQFALAQDCEITLEANPGVSDAERFAGYHEAGVDRLSIGAQSFSSGKLQSLGRIHDAQQILTAVRAARIGGFHNLNLDIMFGLPGQTSDQALDDLQQAAACGPTHLSWYELTLEPHTAFHRSPPPLPNECTIEQIRKTGLDCLRRSGFQQYEVSAFARPGYQCRHNLNYWHFGDYVGIGAGAHAKLTQTDGSVRRRWRIRRPEAYVASAGTTQAIGGDQALTSRELVLEFALNVLRLVDGVEEAQFTARCFQSFDLIADRVASARKRDLLVPHRLQATTLGWRFLDDLIAMFHVD